MIKYSQDVLNKLKADAKDRETAINLSKILSKRRKEADNGYIEPIEDNRDFDELEQDEIYQKQQLTNNTRQLIKNSNESTKLAQKIDKYGLTSQFNAFFPIIFKQLSNSKPSSEFLFPKIENIIYKQRNNDYDNEPLTTQEFKQTIESVLNKLYGLTDVFGNNAKFNDYIDRLSAVGDVSEYGDDATIEAIQESIIRPEDLQILSELGASTNKEEILTELQKATENITQQSLTEVLNNEAPIVSQDAMAQDDEEPMKSMPEEEERVITNRRNIAKARYSDDTGDIDAIAINYGNYKAPDLRLMIQDAMENGFNPEDTMLFSNRKDRSNTLKSNISRNELLAFVSSNISEIKQYLEPKKTGTGLKKKRKPKKK